MRIIAVLSVILVLLTGCVPVQTDLSPLPVPTSESGPSPVDTQPRSGEPPSDEVNAEGAGLVGKMITQDRQPITNNSVSLAQVFWNEDRSDGAFVLNGAASPTTPLQEDGTFNFANVSPGEYVIVIGDPTGSNVIVTLPDGKAKVIELVAGETLDVGELQVAWELPS